MNVKPLSQGRLDCLCSIYAGINLMRLNKTMPDDELSAWNKFRHAVQQIQKHGDITATIIKGMAPPDIDWLLKVLGAPNITQIPTSDVIAKVRPKSGVMIFFRKKEEPKTHYTVVQHVDGKSGDYILFDSYGFDRLTAGRYLEGETVNITHAWVASA